jgi:hypothetical protein
VWIYPGLLALFVVSLWFARPLLRGDASSGP